MNSAINAHVLAGKAGVHADEEGLQIASDLIVVGTIHREDLFDDNGIVSLRCQAS